MPQDSLPLALIASALGQTVKWAIIIVALLNCRSWPFVWTVRVFLPVAKYFFASWIFDFTLLFRSRKLAQAMRRERNAMRSRIGKNPLQATTSYLSWCGFDDCDYNLHMSNSAYPKILDMVRMKAALEHFPAYLRTGGFLVLAGTHFEFIREIPMFTRYEARVSIAAWDDKWLYLIARFVTFPKVQNSVGRQTSLGPLVPLKEHDGAMVHCVSINQFVFKHGRITVPPPLALACDGYSSLSHDGRPYTVVEPPPHWHHVKKIIKDGGGKAMRNYMKSWKTVPEEERWWTTAFAGPIESQRAANLALIQGISKGMRGARNILAAD
ncbi:hypothetical protein C8R47DRAFT_1149159 [Mycena vitilis]|nr:hypothetical protein C8R47DRAFT_1149159 [Mycena vitilis]